MGIAAIATSYKDLAHGALNWDGPLRTDMAAVTTAVNALVGLDTAFQPAGTVSDFGQGFVCRLRASGNLVCLLVNINPGGNALSASTNNNLIGTVPSGYRPPTSMKVTFAAYNAGNFLGVGAATLNTAGQFFVESMPGGTLPNGGLLSANVTYLY